MDDDSQVRSLLEEALNTGRTPDEVCATRPDLLNEVRSRWLRIRALRDELDRAFPSSEQTHLGSSPSSPTELPRIPGYEMQGVIGVGGMGVVARARHLRLNRTVALKMMRSGGYAGPREVERFKREVQAVAALQHPNIVQVHDAGEHNGCPYFTMELVEGLCLSDLLAGVPQPAAKAAETVGVLARAVQAAHAAGIVHRDLKPANVLLGSDGTVKITDFGLARHFDGSAGPTITLTGERVGTPSYMAPEQALGSASSIGPAVDVYALGAILYEMLTGRPPFRAESLLETQRQVVEQEPVPPSRLNAKVPRDLDTISLKCLQKAPSGRYQSAEAVADDLRRFLDHEPILARQIGRTVRVLKWIRRKPTAAALVATALALVTLAVGSGLRLAQQQGQRRAELRAEVGTAVTQAVSLRKGFHFREAQALLERARQRLESDGPDDLRRQVLQEQADLRLVENLDAARLRAAMPADGTSGAEQLYQETLEDARLGHLEEDSAVVAGRVRNSSVRAEIVAALDDWAGITQDEPRREWLLAVNRAADPDPTRDRLRQPELWRDAPKLARIVHELHIEDLSPQLLTVLGRALTATGGQAVPLLSAAQARYPQDFWLNIELGWAYCKSAGYEESLSFYRAAMALRPGSANPYNGVGENLFHLGRLEEAIDYFQRAVDIEPRSYEAHNNLAFVLSSRGRLAEAIIHYRESIRLNAGATAGGHDNLGHALVKSGLLAEAIKSYQDAIRLEPNPPRLYINAAAVIRALAAEGSSESQPREEERAGMRRQALDWLRAALELRTQHFKEGQAVNWSLTTWQSEPALASVRDPAALAKLPESEREQWLRFWKDVAAHVNVDSVEQGRVLAAHRNWAGAAECYGRALGYGATDDGYSWFEYAAVLLLSDDRTGYANACAHMVERCGEATNMRAYHVARACTLAPDNPIDASLPARLVEAELVGTAAFWSLTERGALLYRVGRFPEAVDLFERSLRADARPGRAVLNWLWLALANEKLGNPAEARRWLDTATTWLNQFHDGMPSRAEAEWGLHLHNWLEAHVLRREAEAAITPN